MIFFRFLRFEIEAIEVEKQELFSQRHNNWKIEALHKCIFRLFSPLINRIELE